MMCEYFWLFLLKLWIIFNNVHVYSKYETIHYNVDHSPLQAPCSEVWHNDTYSVPILTLTNWFQFAQAGRKSVQFSTKRPLQQTWSTVTTNRCRQLEVDPIKPEIMLGICLQQCEESLLHPLTPKWHTVGWIQFDLKYVSCRTVVHSSKECVCCMWTVKSIRDIISLW